MGTSSNLIDYEEIKINPDIKALLPDRSEQEQNLLKQSILENGIQTKLIVTKFDGQENVLIDGHGRLQAFKELVEAEKIKASNCQIRVLPQDFENLEAIKAYMFQTQLGRRNLSTQHRNYLIGQFTVESEQTHATLAKQFSTNTKLIQRSKYYFENINKLVKHFDCTKDKLFKLSINRITKVSQDIDNYTFTDGDFVIKDSNNNEVLDINDPQEERPKAKKATTKVKPITLKVEDSRREKVEELATEHDMSHDDLLTYAIDYLIDNPSVVLDAIKPQ